ncbi:MAG: signal peptidase I [bacterium]|nr:signal peptidase I [bacterium]
MIVRIKNCIFKIIYILVIIYLIIFIPTIWGYKPLVVISGSMEPTLKTGGILYYHKKEYQDFKKNDILVYQLNDHTISHRVYDITDDGIITKGDANKTYDNLLITKDRILGEGTKWCIPFIGYYADYIYRNKYLLIITIGIILIDIVFEKNKKVGVKDEKDN